MLFGCLFKNYLLVREIMCTFFWKKKTVLQSHQWVTICQWLLILLYSNVVPSLHPHVMLPFIRGGILLRCCIYTQGCSFFKINFTTVNMVCQPNVYSGDRGHCEYTWTSKNSWSTSAFYTSLFQQTELVLLSMYQYKHGPGRDQSY